MGWICHHGRGDAAGLRRAQGRRTTPECFRLDGGCGADLRSAPDDLQLQLAGLPAAADGRRTRTAVQVPEADHSRERPVDLRAIPVDVDHDPADGISHRPDRRLHRRGTGQPVEVHQRLLTTDLRDPDPTRVPVHGAVGTALADQRHHAAQHSDPGLRLHPGPDGRMELRLLRCHRRCALPGLA